MAYIAINIFLAQHNIRNSELYIVIERCRPFVVYELKDIILISVQIAFAY